MNRLKIQHFSKLTGYEQRHALIEMFVSILVFMAVPLPILIRVRVINAHEKKKGAYCMYVGVRPVNGSHSGVRKGTKRMVNVCDRASEL